MILFDLCCTCIPPFFLLLLQLTLMGDVTSDGTPIVLQMGTANANTGKATPWAETVSLLVMLLCVCVCGRLVCVCSPH